MKNSFLLLCLFAMIACNQSAVYNANSVVPSPKQIAYQQMELVGFIHFGMNTFTNKEWGYGNEDPKLFNPTNIDVEQWVQTARAAGMKELILTTKHHDGFCLWPSTYTGHSIKNSPYKNGKGDLLKEFTDACRKYNIKPGFYLSPWDRNHPDYGFPGYIEYYTNQLKEILSNYGEIYEVWFDGANGGDGYYGGANETRSIDPESYYPWEKWRKLVYELQPKASIFSDAGPDLRWIGNEKGYAGETFWSPINADQIIIGKSDASYLNKGEMNGSKWVVGICDVSIRPGWFYHQKEDRLVRSPQNLVDLYYKSVGRNAVLLLNIPPNKEGRIQENDVKSLKEFRSILDETFNKNLAEDAGVKSSSEFSKAHSAKMITDSDAESFWAAKAGETKAELELRLKQVETFDRIVLQEPIKFGQRISGFEVQAFINKEWKTITKGTTIGFKRILRIPVVHTDRIKLIITDTGTEPAISSIALYKASNKE